MIYDHEQIPIMKNFIKILKTKNAELKVMISLTPDNRKITAMVGGVGRSLFLAQFKILKTV
jgi:hypothetical protein